MINEIFATGIKLKIVDRTDSEKIHLLRTNPSVAKFITRNLDLSVADIENLIEERLSDLENILFYKIETLPDLELAGTIVLKNIDQKHKCAEVGYELFPKFEGQGLMKTTLSKIIAIAFEKLELNELEAFTHYDNLKSRKLLEKLGFKSTDKVDADYPHNMIYKLKKACM